jgi:hypothetical protein
MADKPVVYIAGPMSGLPEYNYPAFHAAAAMLRGKGYTVINPAELDDGNKNQDKPWEWWMKRSLAQMMQADVIYMLEGWEDSFGALIEHDLARKLNMRRHYAGGDYGN